MNLNLNNVNKKVVLFLSVVGAILSFIAGLLSRTPFINLFFKSILSGIIIGIITFGANIVIILFLPELLEDKQESDDDDEADSTNIDIVMPDEGYTVQTVDSDQGVENTESNQGESESSTPSEQNFKGIGLDNLQNLSDSTFESNEGINNNSDEIQSSSPASSSVANGSDFGDHSVEEMAKAVKTVLKKD